MSSLLEVTDNVVGDEVVGVPRRRDGDDPYLVVAADRGTATFSDLANRLSQEHGFWLGDAFASGGSHGYDHKRLGITARGAWVAVRHHFAELEIDLDTEPVTVAGIGDMSGDVFGNAMLRSDRIRLVAAFDHRDIFLDPDPDPALSYGERARLFALPGSSWQDYDRSLISAGGGVWSRLDKRIPVERARCGPPSGSTRASTVASPPELIRAILQAPVALLFAGGIGTFVRATDEPDREIDDRANAELRVTGVAGAGPGGGGGGQPRLHPAGPHRVRPAGRPRQHRRHRQLRRASTSPTARSTSRSSCGRRWSRARSTIDERDRLLAEVTDDVVAAVLHDSARQSMALSRAVAASAGRVAAVERADGPSWRRRACSTGRWRRCRPPSEMAARARAGAGLTRPELAVLLAGAKRGLTAALLASGVPDQPALRAALVAYFPTRCRIDWMAGSTVCSTGTGCAGSWWRRWWPTRWSTGWA